MRWFPLDRPHRKARFWWASGRDCASTTERHRTPFRPPQRFFIYDYPRARLSVPPAVPNRVACVRRRRATAATGQRRPLASPCPAAAQHGGRVARWLSARRPAQSRRELARRRRAFCRDELGAADWTLPLAGAARGDVMRRLLAVRLQVDHCSKQSGAWIRGSERPLCTFAPLLRSGADIKRWFRVQNRTCQTVQSAGRDGKGSFGQVQVWLARLGALWLRRGKHRLILILAATLCPNNCFPFLFVFQSSAMVEIKPPRHRLPHPPPVAEAIVRWALLSPGLDPCRSAGSALFRVGGRRITTIPIASRHQPIVNSNDRRSLAVRKVWPFLAPVPFRRARHFAFAKHRINARTHACPRRRRRTDACLSAHGNPNLR